jgi:hypothetical protein
MNFNTQPVETILMQDGIGRLAYVGGHALLAIGTALLWHSCDIPGIGLIALALILAASILSCMLMLLRLDNIGMERWWVFIALIPLIGLYVTVLCVAAPEGYRDHKQLDTVGGAIVAAIAALVTIVIALIIFG